MSKKLLVIDDEPGITMIVERIASDLGFDVRVLNDTATAVELFDEFQPDILMLDLVMPNLDGIYVLKQVLAKGTSAKVIVMSGYGRSYLQSGKLMSVFNEHPDVMTLSKPFRRADVIALLAPQGVDDQDILGGKATKNA